MFYHLFFGGFGDNVGKLFIGDNNGEVRKATYRGGVSKEVGKYISVDYCESEGLTIEKLRDFWL
jgi:hypothetical protein